MPDKRPKKKEYVEVVVNGRPMRVRKETAKRNGWSAAPPADSQPTSAASNSGGTWSWSGIGSGMKRMLSGKPNKPAQKQANKPTAPAKPTPQKPTAKPQGQQRQMPKGTPWYADKSWMESYNQFPTAVSESTSPRAHTAHPNLGQRAIQRRTDEQTGKELKRRSPMGNHQMTPSQEKKYRKEHPNYKKQEKAVQKAFDDIDRKEQDKNYAKAQLKEEEAAQARVDNAMEQLFLTIDKDNTLGDLWAKADEQSRLSFEERLKNRGILEELAMYEGFGLNGGQVDRLVKDASDALASHYETHDLENLANQYWNRLGATKQNQIINGIINYEKQNQFDGGYDKFLRDQAVVAAKQELKNWDKLSKAQQNEVVNKLIPEVRKQYDGELRKEATKMARNYSNRRVYNFAVQMNAPKDALDGFLRGIENNSVGMGIRAFARTKAGTPGDLAARMEATQRYNKEHGFIGGAGNIAGMVTDPALRGGGALASGTTKVGVGLVGKMFGQGGKAIVSKASQGVLGKMTLGAIQGAINLGTFETIHATLNQGQFGGVLDYDENGLPVVKEYSGKEIAKSAGHGALAGFATGVFGAGFGHYGNKFVQEATSAGSKTLARTLVTAAGVVGEGTVFLLPDYFDINAEYDKAIAELSNPKSDSYEADEVMRAAKADKLNSQRSETMFESWEDSVAFVLGLKLQHGMKNIPETGGILFGKGRGSFAEKWGKLMDGNTFDLALTDDEKRELDEHGYGSLKEIAIGALEDARRKKSGEESDSEEKNSAEYEKFTNLIKDNNVSEAARAKMIFYATGKVPPMSPVLDGNMREVKDEKGRTRYVVESVGENGIITSRTFKGKDSAEAELLNVMRSAELNTYALGETNYANNFNIVRFKEACERVAEEMGMASTDVALTFMKGNSELSGTEKELKKKVAATVKELGDDFVNSQGYRVRSLDKVREYVSDLWAGTDIEKAINKKPEDRDDLDARALQYYTKILYGVDPEAKDVDVNGGVPPEGGGTPPADGGNPPEGGAPAVEGAEEVNPIDAAYQRGLNSDEQGMRDIYLEHTNNPSEETEAAWNGVVEQMTGAANEAAETERARIQQMQHKADGSVRQAVLKEPDENGNIKSVYIVDGNVQMTADGSMVDPDASDKSVVIFDPATGESKMIDPTSDTGISSLVNVRTAEDIENYINMYRVDTFNNLHDQAIGKVRLNSGEQITLPDGTEAVVLGIDGDNVILRVGEDRQTSVSLSELQKIADENALEDYRRRHSGDVSEFSEGVDGGYSSDSDYSSGVSDVAEGEPVQGEDVPQGEGLPQREVAAVEGAPDDFTPDMVVVIREDDGTEKSVGIMGRVRYEKEIGEFVPDDEGGIVEFYADGKVRHERIDKMRDKVVRYIKAEDERGDAEEDIDNSGYSGYSEDSGYRGEEVRRETEETGETRGATESAEVPEGVGGSEFSEGEEGALERGNEENITYSGNSSDSGTEAQATEEQPTEEVSPARQTYNAVREKYGEKVGSKLDATVADRQADLERAESNLAKAQDKYDKAPIGKETKAENELNKAKAEYDAAAEELKTWQAVKAEHDKETPKAAEVASVPENEVAGGKESATNEPLPAHKRPVEETIFSLYSRPEGGEPFTVEQVVDFIDENIKQADRDVKKLANSKPKVSQNADEYRKNIAEFNAAKAEAEERADYWRKVKAENERITHLDDDGSIGEPDVDNMDIHDPDTIEEWVATAFLGKHKYKITPESYKAETGYSTGDMRKNVGVIAKKENGGMTVEHCAEKIWADLPEGLQSQYDQQDVRNIILDMAQGGNLAGAARRILDNKREKLISEYEQYYGNEREKYYQDKYGMTPDEAMAYEERMLPETIDRLSTMDDQKFREEMVETYDERDKIRNLANEKEQINNTKDGDIRKEHEPTGEGDNRGKSGEILLGEGADEQGRGSEGTDARGTFGIGSEGDNQGKNVPEGAPRGENVVRGTAEGEGRDVRTDLSQYDGTEERISGGQGQEGLVQGRAYAGLPGLVENELSRRLSERQRNLYDALAKTLGIEIEFTDGDYSGVYDNNRVRISLETAKDGRAVLSAVIAHEVTHHLKDHVGEDVWNTLEAAVRRAMGDEAFEAAVKENVEKHNNYIDELRAKGEGNGLSHLTEEGGREETVSYFFQHEALQDEASAVRFLKSLEGDSRTVSQVAKAVRDFLLDLWRRLRGTGNERAVKDALDVWENACKIVGADVREQRAVTEAVAETPKSVRSDVEDGKHKVVAAQEAVDKIDAAITDARDKVEASIADKTSRYMDVQAEIRRLTKEHDAKIETLRDRADALKKEYGRGSDELKQQMKPLKEEVKRVDKEYTDALQSLRNERYQLQEEIDAARNSPEYTSETERLKSEYEAAREAYKNTVNDYYQTLRDLPEDARRSALADLSNTLEDFESERLLENYDAAVEGRRDAISDADYEAMDKQSMEEEVRRLADALDDAIDKDEGIAVAREALNDYLGHLSDAEFAALRFYMADKVEFYYGGARLGSSIREDILGDEYKRREERIARSKVSAKSVEKSASLPQVKAKAVKSFDISVAASKDKERIPVLTAVNHEGGWETATDGTILFAEKTGTRKNGLYVKDKKGKESKIEGDYPKWRSVIPTKDTNPSKVDVQSLRDFLSSVKANNAKDFRDGKARVIIRTDYGDYLYNAKRLSQVADFMEKHGIDELQFEGRYGKTAAQNKSAIGLLMPMFFEGSGLEELEAFGYDIRTDKRGERFSLGDSPESFDARRERAVEEKGVVMPGLNKAEVRVVDIPRHKYTGNIKEATQQAIEAAKAKYAPNGEPITLHYNNYGAEFDYSISGRAIAESLNPRQQAKSSNKGIHLAVAEHLDEVINNSIEVEEHPDYEKNGKGERDGVRFNNNALMHRFYGTISNEGKTYRVMILMREDRNPDVGDGVHAYEVQKIEVLDDKTSSTPNGVDSGEQIDSSYPLAKILKDVEKSYDPGKKILDASLDADNSQARFSLPNEREDKKPVFYSNAQRAVEGIRQEKAKAEQWLAMIQKQGGLKAAEDKWIGLSDWLNERKGESLKKQEVLDYIRENDVRVEEVAYGEYGEIETPDFVRNYQEEYRNYYNEAIQKGESEVEAESYAWRMMLDNHGDDFALGFTFDGDRLLFDEDSPYNTYLADQFGEKRPIDRVRLEYTTKGLENKREIALTVPTVEPYNESDTTHFGDAGEGRAVAWIRFGETKDKDGNSVLVIDEIQSKRHQDGREKGYGKSEIPYPEKKDVRFENVEFDDGTIARRGVYDVVFNGNAKRFESTVLKENDYVDDDVLHNINRQVGEVNIENYHSGNSLVPDAPFDKNWHELAMKRMLRYAAENGYDKVAWTTGAQQAERYDISKIVDSIELEYVGKNGRKMFGLKGFDFKIITDTDGKIVKSMDELVGKNLSDVVGKDVANKMLEMQEGDVIEGNDLRIGGEGMKGFYDQILPRFMDKYGKKWGVKTGMVELPFVEESGRTMHAVDVTPEMRESVMQGQPKFSLPSKTEDVSRGYQLFLFDDGMMESSGRRYSMPEEKEADYIKPEEAGIKDFDGLVHAGNYGEAMRKMGVNTLVDYAHKTKKYKEEKRPVTMDDYFESSRTDFERVETADAEKTWEDLKQRDGMEWHKSPKSESEYLEDRENGVVYRKSDHWGNVASCRWTLDGKDVQGEVAIGRSSIDDFGDKDGYRVERVPDGAYDRGYADRLRQTVANYEAVLNDADVNLSGSARRAAESAHRYYSDLLDAYEDKGYVERSQNRMRYSLPEDKEGEDASVFHSVINEMFDNADFDKSAHARERYDLGATPEWMKGIGISGERFTLSFKNIKTHQGKDADHDLTREEWHQLPEALQTPFAVTRYNSSEDRFRMYVNILHNGHFVAVGVDVKRVNKGRGFPMLEVNSIKTVFAHHGEIGGKEELITWDKNITPEQQALLRGLNYREYPTIQELSDAKVQNQFEISKDNIDNGQRFSLPEEEWRTEEEQNAATAHDAMSRKGLREIVGKEGYDAFLDDVGRRLRDDVKKEVSSSAGRAFLDDILGDGAKGEGGERMSYDERRRAAVGNLLGELADKPFEDFTERDRVLWQKAKAAAREAIEKDGALPKWFELGDNELRYMLWRGKEGIESDNAHPIDVARDIVKREELGLGENNARFSLPDVESGESGLPDVERGTAGRREKSEMEKLWADGSMSLDERVALAAIRLSDANKADMQKRDDAVQAIGRSLGSINRILSAQRGLDGTTVKRVTDLARVLMNTGHLSDLSNGEVKKLLSAIGKAMSHKSVGMAADYESRDLHEAVQKVMDVMVDNQVKQGRNTLDSLLKIKGSKVDAKGVEVQGKLDPEGVRIMNTFKKARKWDKTDIEESIADAQDRISSDNKVTADNASSELAGLQLALQYADNIKSSKVEEQKLRDEIRRQEERIYDFEEVEKTDANGKVVNATTKTLKPEFKGAITEENRQIKESVLQSVSAMQDAIRQGKIDRAQGYRDLVVRLSGTLGKSMEKAQEFRDAEQQRIQEIHHNANSDMKGRPSNEHYKPPFASKAKNVFANSLLAPLSTFEQFMRMLGSKSANGEGYLYNRFVRQWVDARQKEITGIRDKFATLDAKAEEIFNGKVKSWGELIRFVGKLPKGKVSFMNGGEMRESEINQGNLMYIYMVNKMLDGKMKLRSMGITEEDVANIEQALDPRLIRLADWLQDEFLVSTREEYNETHKRMFGASMAAIEDYFPLKILANARTDKAEDLDNPNQGKGISTSTGSIVKRTRNNSALDITNANALNVVLDHITEMEHWNAFAEFKRDINTLRTYKRFRNQIKNMDTAYGNGEKLWQRFNDLCQMATGDYIPPRAALDEAMVNIAKGVTAAKVSFRVFTALKQFLSSPAYLSEARIDYLAKNLLNPYDAWRWSMENLPIFRERWQGRTAGDPRLAKSDKDWSVWRSRVVELASRYGMAPNAFVDALTVSIGAHSIYQTKRGRYLREGYSEAEADKRAIQDAEIAYNQTQQSSESIFLSPMQVDRSWAAVTFTIFRNASMAYERQLLDALRNMRNNLNFKKREERIEFMKKQYMRDGISEAQAEKNARRKYSRQILKDAIRIGVFGYVMQFAWNLGAYLPYIIFGDDDDVKSKYWDDVLTHSKFGSIEGLTGGDAISSTLNLLAGEDKLTRSKVENAMSKEMPFTSDAINTMVNFATGKYAESINDMVNLAVQAGFGVNPQSITDALLAVADACGDDPALTHEATICIARILQIPQSQLDNLYFDELGLNGNEVSKYSIGQLAERYAKYRAKRGTFAAAWAWNDEGYLQKGRKKFDDKATERIAIYSDGKLKDMMNSNDEVSKKYASKEAAKRLGVEDYFSKSDAPAYNKEYVKHRDYVDLAEDVVLQQAAKRAKENGDAELLKEIKSVQRKLTGMRKELVEEGADVKDVMNEIRSYRREKMNELGL